MDRVFNWKKAINVCSEIFTFDDLEKRNLRERNNKYESLRHEIKTGDVFAFGGKKRASNIIKLVTRGPVSHVGIVVDFDEGRFGGRNVMLVESTSLNKTSGVQMRWLSHAVFNYIGEIWWLKMSKERRKRMDETKLKMFLRNQIGKPYDTKGAIQAGVDKFSPFGIFDADEDLSELFCSELIMAAYEASGVIEDINVSEVTPIEMCRYKLWDRQEAIRGEIETISGFNTMEIK